MQMDYGAADGPQGRWLVTSRDDSTKLVALYMPTAGPTSGPAQLVTTTVQPMSAFGFHRELPLEEVIYCTTAGVLRRRVTAGPGVGTESVVTLPPNMTCAGDSIVFIPPDAEKGYYRVLFGFSQYGLGGIAELDLSP
jgi:hypothetical protein